MKQETPIDGDWDGLVVVCAGAAWEDWYPSEKHIAVRLSERAPVLFVDPPSSPVDRRRGSRSGHVGLRILGPRLAVLTPNTLPAQSRRVMFRVTKFLTLRAIRRAVQALGVSRARAIVVANHVDLFDAVDADHRILFATDDFVAGASLLGLDRKHLLAEERNQAAHADCVVVVTDELAKRWRDLGHDPVLIPNGCDAERFKDVDIAPLPDDVDLPSPRAGVFGHLSNRIDMALLEAVAGSGVSLLLIGTRQRSFSLDSLLALENVQYLGPKPFDLMPSYLRAIDVGLTPYADIDFNRASFPLKTLEYLAAGRAAVSTDLPAVRWLATDLITTADSPQAFAAAVVESLDHARSEELVGKRQAFAQRHSWSARAEAFSEVIGLGVEVGTAEPAGLKPARRESSDGL